MTDHEYYISHSGVKGMKHGVRRWQNKDGSLTPAGKLRYLKGTRNIDRKNAANEKLKAKALKYDKKQSAMTKKSERAHALYDLEEANSKAVKSAVYASKASKLERKAYYESDATKQMKYANKAAKYKYKSAKLKTKADRLSLSTGYGSKAMRYAIKSDKAAQKAAKARLRIAENERYVALMEMKMSELESDED